MYCHDDATRIEVFTVNVCCVRTRCKGMETLKEQLWHVRASEAASLTKIREELKAARREALMHYGGMSRHKIVGGGAGGIAMIVEHTEANY